MEKPNNPIQVKCPQCGRLTLYALENSFRPFCSERCKTIDLGDWASEKYRIPAPSSDAFSEEDFKDEENDFDA